MERLKLGLVVARREKPLLSELDRFLRDGWADVFLFPENYLHSEALESACQIVKTHGKWLVTSMDDRREPGQPYETGIIIGPDGSVLGEHKKTSLTQYELDQGTTNGTSIEIIETPFGSVGLSVCYEIFFPEVTRIYTLQGARIIFNPINTGMWHEQQYTQWNNVASARAAENGVFVAGCSHYNDAIPLAFAYDPEGRCLVQSREANRMVRIILDLNKRYETTDLGQRRPLLYGELCVPREKRQAEALVDDIPGAT